MAFIVFSRARFYTGIDKIVLKEGVLTLQMDKYVCLAKVHFLFGAFSCKEVASCDWERRVRPPWKSKEKVKNKTRAKMPFQA